jgi:hypothetical protein
MTGLVILALGGYGRANGDGWDVLGKSTKLFCVDRRDGERGDEINGVLFDGEWLRDARIVKLELFEGDRDSDRRNCLIAELAST